jgi:hypothetical protein
MKLDTYWERTVQEGFLKEKGWTMVTDRPKDRLFAQILGWIKEPSMKMYTLEEAFDKETTCQGQE